jgi:hypothetical protein
MNSVNPHCCLILSSKCKNTNVCYNKIIVCTDTAVLVRLQCTTGMLMSPKMVMFYFIAINLKYVYIYIYIYIYNVTLKSSWTVNCISVALLSSISETVFIRS